MMILQMMTLFDTADTIYSNNPKLIKIFSIIHRNDYQQQSKQRRYLT